MIQFTKMHGLGNDYVVINRLNDENIISNDEIPSLVRILCDRHYGIGADGVVFVEKSKIADFKMSIYNKDGNEAQMCGNGIRCFSKYVYEKGLIHNKVISIETLAGIKQAYLHFNRGNLAEITTCMGKPILDLQSLKNEHLISDTFESKIRLDNKIFEALPVSMGNPHAIIFTSNVDKFDVKKYGSIIEGHKNFPQKTNVEFVQIIDRSYIKIRVWERGAGETLACGTGACATLAVCNILGFTRNKATIGLPGGNLKATWNKQDNNIYLTGIATKVFEGKINL